MNHLTNLYKHKCEQLQEQIYCLTRMLNEVNAPLPTQGTPSVVPPNGIDPGMFDPRLIPRYERPTRDPSSPVPGVPSEEPQKNPQDGSIWYDTGGNTWIFRGGLWHCIVSRPDRPMIGMRYDPRTRRIYFPWQSDAPGNGFWDWWNKEFYQQTPGQAFDQLWREYWQWWHGYQGPPTATDREGNPLVL